jgi:polyphosphate kinase 2 (PPK2 family)
MKKIDAIKNLQLKILRIQQGNFHKKERVIIVFEGFDAAGKGGAIRKITENLDPRGFKVWPIGVPTEEEQGKHYLYRFWENIPGRGHISIFDRSWYGRVLVERVEDFIPKKAWKRAYKEINQFEKLLIDDGVVIIKIFLKISKAEQLKRFEERLKDPYKQWKITKDDIHNRKNWDKYIDAVKEMQKETSTDICPWNVVKTDDKNVAREKILKIIATKCKHLEEWMEDQASQVHKTKELKKLLADLD